MTSESDIARPRRLRRRFRRPVRRVWRFVVPPSSTRREQHTTRDLLEDELKQRTFEEAFVRSAHLFLPAIGLFLITLNILIQTLGNTGLAIAIVQNLSFGALTLTILLNLSLFMLYGALIALLPASVDREYSARIRRVSSVVVLAVVGLLIMVAPFFATLAIVLLVTFGRYFAWRRGRKVSRGPEQSVTFEDILRRASPPADVRLWILWVRGRTMLRSVGIPLDNLEAEQTHEPLPEPAPLRSLLSEWNERTAAIRGAGKKTVYTLLYTGIVGFTTTYGALVVFTPIRFAPQELVTINSDSPEVGFLLYSESGGGIFLTRGILALRGFGPDDQVDHVICARDSSPWIASLPSLLSPIRGESIDCSSNASR